MVSSKRPHSLHFGSTSGFLRVLCWYQRVERLWSWAAMIKPSVSVFYVIPFHPLWVFAVGRFWLALGPELLETLVFGLGLYSAGIGGVRLIICRWYCRHSQFPTELHWLSADGVHGFPVVMVFDKVEESVLRLLEIFIKTDSGLFVGKLQLYEPSTSFGPGLVQPCPRQIWSDAYCT